MIPQVMQKKRGQVQVSLTPSGFDAYRAWLSENGYHQKMAFVAGWMALREMTHEQRSALFARVDQFERDGFSSKVARADDDRPAKPRRATG
jgi:hypothetical protein